MSGEETRAFLLEGTRTGKLATTRADGRPHVTPIWFVLAGDQVVWTTGENSVKAKTIRRDPRVCMCVDDQTPPYWQRERRGRGAARAHRAGARACSG